MKLRDLLIESLYNIQDDVDTLYEKGLSQLVSDIEAGKRPYDIFTKNRGYVTKSKVTVFETDSSALVSDDCKKAHAMNPVKIFFRVGDTESHYAPALKHIVINIPYQILEIIYKNLQSSIAKHQQMLFKNELSVARLKGTISHELAHWIDDSVNSFHINRKFHTPEFSSRFSSPDDGAKGLQKLLGVSSVNASYIEIQAQIHAIKQIKERHRNEWDTLTLIDLFILNPPLYWVLESIKNSAEQKKWLQQLVKRMNREGLLGKNMRKLPTMQDIKDAHPKS